MKKKIFRTLLLGVFAVLTLLGTIFLVGCSAWRRLPSPDAPKEIPASTSAQEK